MIRRSAALSAFSAALLLTGCSASSGLEAEPHDSPLDAYLSLVYGEEDALAAEEDAAETQDLIARCMTEAGFEYVPESADIVFTDDESWRPDDAAWVARWGYGVVTWPGQTEADRSSAGSSPNSAYLDTIGPLAQDAWFETLYGAEPADGADPPSWREQGCWGAAIHEVRIDDPLQRDENLPLMHAIDDFYDTRLDSEDYAALDTAWADCMADAGRTGFARQGDADLSVRARVSDYYAELDGDAPNDVELDALHDSEVELALVDLECREKTDYQQLSSEIEHTQEEQFVADHRTELDALVADAAARR